jgi:hypothetical protein
MSAATVMFIGGLFLLALGGTMSLIFWTPVPLIGIGAWALLYLGVSLAFAVDDREKRKRKAAEDARWRARVARWER